MWVSKAKYEMHNISTSLLSQVLDFPMGALSGEVIQLARFGTKGHSVVIKTSMLNNHDDTHYKIDF